MTYRGYLTLNGVEIANTSRVAAHIGASIPTLDLGLISGENDCSLTPVDGHPLLAVPADSQAPIDDDHPLLYTPADGSRLFSPGLAVIGDCWDDTTQCFGCRDVIQYNDSWDGLQEFLGDSIYRPELAPWFSLQVPESGEFGGIWVMDIKGLDVAAVQVDIAENAGDGGAPGIPRDPSRKITFDALLVACTNAGLEYGLQWLACQLKAVNSLPAFGTLRYLAAHPGNSAVDPATLMREAYGVVMTQAPSVQSAINTGRTQHQAATVYRVSWELTITTPKIYLPSVPLTVEWDTMTLNPIKWVHAADCGAEPAGCDPDPKMFAADCEIETITEIMSPPPSCGGCLPVCLIATHVYTVPSFTYPMRCRDSAVSITVRNVGDENLNLQAYFRRCNVRDECDNGDRWPLQITSLPPTAELVLDAPTGTYWVNYFNRRRRPFGIVGTPTGAPWRPPVIDRALCWEFVVLAPGTAAFEVDMRLADREA